MPKAKNPEARIIEYFENAPLEAAKVIHSIAKGILARRAPAPMPAKSAKPGKSAKPAQADSKPTTVPTTVRPGKLRGVQISLSTSTAGEAGDGASGGAQPQEAPEILG